MLNIILFSVDAWCLPDMTKMTQQIMKYRNKRLKLGKGWWYRLLMNNSTTWRCKDIKAWNFKATIDGWLNPYWISMRSNSVLAFSSPICFGSYINVHLYYDCSERICCFDIEHQTQNHFCYIFALTISGDPVVWWRFKILGSLFHRSRENGRTGWTMFQRRRYAQRWYVVL